MTMRLSPRGLDFLRKVEGVRLRMYLDSGGAPTIGIGHLLTKEELRTGVLRIGDEVVHWRKRGLTEDQATRLKIQDARAAEAAVRRHVTVPLEQHQFDTLVSFTFNIGAGAFASSTLLRLLNAGRYDEVPGQLRRWVYDNGVKVEGLVNRRAAEIRLWGGA